MAQAIAPDRQRYLNRQIELIRDTDDRAVHEVIVKMRTPEAREDPALMATVAAAMQRRFLSSSARFFVGSLKRLFHLSHRPAQHVLGE